MTQERADEIVRKVIYARLAIMPKMKDSEDAFHVGRVELTMEEKRVIYKKVCDATMKEVDQYLREHELMPYVREFVHNRNCCGIRVDAEEYRDIRRNYMLRDMLTRARVLR